MERQFFSGNTIEQALMAAARVAYTLRDKKHGFLNIRRRVVIEVDPEAPEKPEPAPGEDVTPGRRTADRGATEQGPESGDFVAPGIIRPDAATPGRRTADRRTAGGRGAGPRGAAADRPPRGPRARDQGPRSAGPYRAEKLGSYREEVLREFADAEGAEYSAGETEGDREIAAFEKAVDEVIALLGLRLEGSVRREDQGFEVELRGADSDLVVADDGELLGAVEHLLPRLVRGFLGHGLPCRVDCAGFRAAREVELKEMAGGMAELARRQGKPQILEPLNPAERRTVHMELAEDPTVETESEGSGFMKRVRILPADDVADRAADDVSRET